MLITVWIVQKVWIQIVLTGQWQHGLHLGLLPDETLLSWKMVFVVWLRLRSRLFVKLLLQQVWSSGLSAKSRNLGIRFLHIWVYMHASRRRISGILQKYIEINTRDFCIEPIRITNELSMSKSRKAKKIPNFLAL